MGRSGDGENAAAAREHEEANIRWLLAAVLHHQPPEDESPDGDA
jgi:hypothetical protein